jgi:DNA-directed RNA polymerase subunit RPC12/RpoP
VCFKYESEVPVMITLKCKHNICIRCYTEHTINSVKELHSIKCPVCRSPIVNLEDMITVDVTNINGPLYNNADIDIPNDVDDRHGDDMYGNNRHGNNMYNTEDIVYDHDCIDVDDDLIKTMRALGVSEEEIQASINRDVSDQKKYLS